MKTKVAHWLMLICLILISGTTLVAQQEREENQEEEGDNPQARLDFELLRTKDPRTGRIPDNIRALEMAFMRGQASLINIPYAAGDITSAWKNRGPFNVGGRTRALAVDSRNESIILAGGVSGGMWRSADQGATWQKTTGTDELQSVTCIAQDPTSPDTWYYGTGEFSGNSASGAGAFFLGDGIYKSTDNGVTWAVLPSTQSDTPQSFDSNFDINMEMVVDPTNGDLYVATVGGLQKSTDGGASFTGVFNGSGQWVDIVVTSAGFFYMVSDNDGVFSSSDGETWNDITAVSGFPLQSGERKELALAPSNEDILYLLGEDSDNSSDHSLWRFDESTDTWTDRSSSVPQLGGQTGDFDSQGGYDLLIKVKSDDENFVIIGGTNLFRSTDGFATSNNTDWIGGYTPTNTSFGLYSDHHPDQHSFAFLSGDKAISGNDGGVQITDDIGSDLGTEAVDWTSINNGYVTTQVYALSAGPGDQIMAGFQDNSTWLTTSTASDATWTDQFGGDGAYNAFNSDGTVRYMSSQRGNIFRVNYDQGADDIVADDFTNFAPNGYTASLFIVPFYLDPSDDDLFYLAGASQLFVNTQAGTGSASVGWKSINLGTSGVVSEIGVSPSNVVFAGTTDGELFKVTDPEGNETVTDISGSNFPDGYVSAVAVDPIDENSILVTFSNYGIPSIFYTSDGGANWDDVSGNLEENIDGTGSGPSVRSATILGNGDKFFVGTSTGLYATTSLTGNAIVWTQENSSGIGEVVVEHLVSRMSDGLVLAGTHGNGIYSANFEITPPADNDLGVVDILSPEEEILTSLSSAVTVSAIIRNFGGLSQNSFDITYLIDDQEIATQTINETIDPGEELEVSFTTTFDFSTAGTYALKVGVALAGDEEDTNDTRTISIVSVTPINTYPFIETFDSSTDLPAQWEIENSSLNWLINGGDTPSVETGPPGDNTSGEGNYAYTEASGSTPGDEAFLVTPWFSITGMERPALQFYYHMFGSQMGNLEVLSIDSNDDVVSLLTLEGEQQESQEASFLEELVELDDFIGQEIRLVFRGTTGSGFRSDIAIDDIRVFNVPLNDLAVTDIESPEEQVSGEEPVIIEVTNLGLNPQSGFEVSYSVNGDLVATETVSGTLAPGASVTYPFTELFDFSETGGYELVATVNLTGDEDTSNDDYETAVTNLPFTGYYIMEQQTETSTGPSSEFGNGYMFDQGGISKVFITAESATVRTFDIRYFNYENFSNSAVPIGFELKDNGEVEVTDQVNSGLACGAGGEIILGPGDTNGAYDEANDNEFSLIIKEDIFQGCQVGSSDVSFVLTKAPPINEADSLALIALYNSTNGPEWNRPWDLEEPAFFWDGVIVSSAGRVIGLILEDNNLDGTLPTEIGDLSALRGLILGGNELKGGLPTQLGDLAELEALILRDNEFSGSIPDEFSGLTKLEELSLAVNRFTGEIPTGLGGLTMLENLSLRSNELTGGIPVELSGLTNLLRLDLGSNNLNGPVPDELSALSILEFLSIAENNLSGQIPEPFSLLTNLQEIFINDNDISGLPDLSDLDPDAFNVDFNNLDFGDLLPNINIIDQYIPQGDIGDPLTLVGMAGEDLNLVTSTSDDGNNEYQWFKDDVAIDGAISTSYGFAYTGTDDEGLYRCDVTNAGVPNLTLSRFITVIDQTVTERPDYAALEAFFNATGGANWVDNSNWLTSEPFDQWAGLSTDGEDRVTAINLSGNNLDGMLPEQMSGLSRLESLQLSNNELDGGLPVSLWNLTTLIDIQLTGNSFEGEIPSEVQNLTNLTTVILTSNQFSGNIPPEIGSLVNLTVLGLGDNDFEGPIPTAIEDMLALISLDLSSNNLSGAIPVELSNLSNLSFLNLASNGLSGEVPAELADLIKLSFLILRNNDLEGLLPQELGGLLELDKLAFEDNSFTGALPDFSSATGLFELTIEENQFDELPDLSALTNLTTFQVQDNNLNFADVLPNIDLLTNYEPQAEIDDPIEEIVNQGTEYTMEVSDDTGGNVYQWYRNEEPIDGADERTFTIADFQVVNEGEYSCEITNPDAPDLTLYRSLIELAINYSPTAVSIDNQSIAENEAVGTLVGTFSVEDIDLEDEYVWVLSGTDAASFTLDDNLIRSNEEFDFETKNSFDITISVKDQGGLSAQVDFTITVTNVNEIPVLATAIDDKSTDEDAAFELTLLDGMFTDEDGDDLTLMVTGLPSGLSFDASTSKITGTPLQAAVGVNTITVTATDPSDASATDSFDLTVVNVNDAPEVDAGQGDLTTDEDAVFEYTIPDGTFSDEDGDDLTLSVTGLPSSLSFNADTRTVTGTPLQVDVAIHTIEVTATDPSSATVTDSFELTISNVNDAPVIAVANTDQTADEDAAFEYEIPAGTFTDEDGDDLTLTVSGLPSTLSFDAATSKISGTPLAADIGDYTVLVTATDPDNTSVTDEFELTVAAVNDAPVLVTELPDVITDRDAPFELVVEATNVTDEEGDGITISASGLPNSLTMTGGTISGTPILGDNGDFTVTITYSDGNGGSVTDSFVLTVNLVTSLEEEQEFGRISIQPNPFVNEIRLLVEKGLFGKTEFSLQPVGGKSVWNSTKNLTGQTELTLQVNKPVSQGIYLLIVMPEGKSPIVRKVIKKE